jgi:hypothetical protein
MNLLPSCDNLGGHGAVTGTYGFTPLDRDLRSHFHHPPCRGLEVIHGVASGPAEADETACVRPPAIDELPPIRQKWRPPDYQSHRARLKRK